MVGRDLPIHHLLFFVLSGLQAELNCCVVYKVGFVRVFISKRMFIWCLNCYTAFGDRYISYFIIYFVLIFAGKLVK